MTGSNHRAVLWDMDGVLVDNGEFHYRSWKETLEAYGIPFDEEQFQRTFGMNNTGVLSIILGRPVEKDFVEEVGGKKEALFREMIRGKVQPLPGVRHWLAWLPQHGYQNAVASSAPQANIDAILDALDLRHYFGAVISAADLPGKPDPTVFLVAARQLGVPPDCCTVVEDALAGVEAAKRAGMRCLAVTTTNPREKLGQADWVVDSLEDLTGKDFDPDQAQ